MLDCGDLKRILDSILALICVITVIKYFQIIASENTDVRSFYQFATMPTNYVWLAFFWIMGKCEYPFVLVTTPDVVTFPLPFKRNTNFVEFQ